MSSANSTSSTGSAIPKTTTVKKTEDGEDKNQGCDAGEKESKPKTVPPPPGARVDESKGLDELVLKQRE